MKKLLVLVLVLSIASVASATLSLTTVTPTQGSEVLAVNAVGESVAAYFGVSIAGADASMIITKGAAAGSNTALAGNIADVNPALVGEIWVYGIGVPPEVWQDGIYANIAVTHTAQADVTLWSYDGDVTLTQIGTVHLTPEPMTLGLLGIGGLFLRRRK